MKMLTIMLASLVLASQAGCGRATYGRLPPPPSEEVRARLGRVVVRSDTDLVAQSVLLPAVASSCSAAALGCLIGIGTGFAVGASLWTGLHLGKGGGGGGGEAAAIVFILIVFVWAFVTAVVVAGGLLVGTLWGLSKAPSDEELERARRMIEKKILEQRFSDRIKAAVLEKAARQTDARVEPWSPGSDRDTILEIAGPRVVLKGPWSFDSRLQLISEIEVRLIGSADGALLHTFRLSRIGSVKSFEEWVGKDGSPVANDLGNPDAFADRIIDEIFLLVELPEGVPQ